MSLISLGRKSPKILHPLDPLDPSVLSIRRWPRLVTHEAARRPRRCGGCGRAIEDLYETQLAEDFVEIRLIFLTGHRHMKPNRLEGKCENGGKSMENGGKTLEQIK